MSATSLIQPRNWQELPAELMKKFLDNLDEDDIEKFERVCQWWSQNVVSQIWRTQLDRMAQEDPHFMLALRARGFDETKSDCVTDRRCYRRLVKGVWKGSWPSGGEGEIIKDLQTYSTEEFQRDAKVISAAVYKNKLFLSRVGGRLESWLLPCGVTNSGSQDDDEQRRVLLPSVSKEEASAASVAGKSIVCAVSVNQDTLAFIPYDANRILTWDADTEEPTRTFTLDGRPGLAFYGLKLTSERLITLVRHTGMTYFYVYDLRRPNEPPKEFTEETREDWLYRHGLEANEHYMVTQVAYAAFNKMGPVYVRSLKDLDKLHFVLKEEEVSEGGRKTSVKEFQSPKLSHKDLLAVLKLACCCSGTKVMIYRLKPQGGADMVRSIPCGAHPLSLLQVPEAWMGERLFLKCVPSPDSYESEVSLVYCDVDKGAELTTVTGVGMDTANDLLCFGFLRLVRIYNAYSAHGKLPPPPGAQGSGQPDQDANFFGIYVTHIDFTLLPNEPTFERLMSGSY